MVMNGGSDAVLYVHQLLHARETTLVVPTICAHIDATTEVLRPERPECEECAAIGATWV